MTEADSTTGRGLGRRRAHLDTALVVLLAAVSPSFLIAISIAEPYAGRILGLPPSEVIWLNEAFMIGTLLLTPMTGSLIDRFGFVRLLRIALVGTLAAAAAIVAMGAFPAVGTQAHVVFGMVALGVLSAPLAPAAQSFVVLTHTKELRGRGMAQWGFGRFAGFMLTALVVGWIIESFGWAMVVVMGLLPLLPCFFLLRQPRQETQDVQRFSDLLGFGLLVLTLLPLLIVLNVAPHADAGSGIWVLPGIAVALFAAWGFVRHVRLTTQPVVSLTPLRDRSFAIATLIAFVVAIMTTGQFSILMLSEVAQVSAEWISLRTVAGGLGQILGVVLGGYLAVPLLARPSAAVALVLIALGLASFTLYGAATDLWSISLTRALMGFGLGLSVPLLAAFAYKSISDSDAGMASSLFVFAGMLGTELGLAILGGIYAWLDATTHDALAAFDSVFWIEAVGTVATAPLVLLLTLRNKAPAATK